jgi:hypothetical protein
MAAHPAWCARYEAVRGRYANRLLPAEKPKGFEHSSFATCRILLRRR